MIVTIHQPDFLPWLGFFDRWRRSDLLIILDDVQFLRRGWQHRDKIKLRNGINWLTVPIKKKGKYHQKINEVLINNKENWKRKHLNTLTDAYKKAPNFEVIFSRIKDVYEREFTRLIDLNMDILIFCANLLKIRVPIRYSSEFNVQCQGTKRLIALVKAVGGNIYLTGVGSKDYLDEETFKSENITVKWRGYESPEYQQLHGPFVKNLSVIDFLMMVPDLDRSKAFY